MTDKQWKLVKDFLNSFGQVKLSIDGYDITLTAGDGLPALMMADHIS